MDLLPRDRLGRLDSRSGRLPGVLLLRRLSARTPHCAQPRRHPRAGGGGVGRRRTADTSAGMHGDTAGTAHSGSLPQRASSGQHHRQHDRRGVPVRLKQRRSAADQPWSDTEPTATSRRMINATHEKASRLPGPNCTYTRHNFRLHTSVAARFPRNPECDDTERVQISAKRFSSTCAVVDQKRHRSAVTRLAF